MSLRDETNPRRPLVLVMSFLMVARTRKLRDEGLSAKSVNHANVEALPATFLPLSLPFDVRFHDGAARSLALGHLWLAPFPSLPLVRAFCSPQK